MASSPQNSSKGIYAQLSERVDPKFEEEKARIEAERQLKQYESAQGKLAELVDANATLPVTVNSVRVVGAEHTRHGFLSKALSHLLTKDKQYTLSELIRDVSVGSERLHRFDIFHQPISTFIDRPDQTNPGTSPTDLDVYLSVTEKSRLTLASGTEVGNAEGSAYANAVYRNIFGGGEQANISATYGTRTRSAYQASVQTPILANPDLWLEAGGQMSTTDKPWSSHEEIQRGGWTLLRYLTKGGHRHELKYQWNWRTVTGVADHASPSIRYEAGDSVKSSIGHTWVSDSRDSPTLPSSGIFAKTSNEICGLGPLGGDVAFWKSELDTQTAFPVPGLDRHGWSLTTGFRAGLLYPLPLGSDGKIHASRINDRFQLGGPSDVRGFKICGLGPRQGQDALGGDVYAAGSANLLFPLPRVGPERPFRGQAFITGGNLSALSGDAYDPVEGMSWHKLRQGMYDTIKAVATDVPSVAVGLGLVYAHPIARFELNFSLPVAQRQRDQARKGLTIGVGINML